MKKLIHLQILCLLLCSVNAWSQGELPVNFYTGSPGIFIDLFTLKDHDLVEPIRLSYNLSDLNLSGSHTYGVGWDLPAGNQQISREVRGLPDDFIGTGSDTRKGWLYNNNYSSILSFPNSSDLSAPTCTDESADQSFLANLLYATDTEPDLYSFSVGEYSGHFVFGNDGEIKLIPYQDILIVPTYQNAPANKTIIGWTITTNSGIVYTLNETCSITRSLTKSNNLPTDGTDQTMLTVLEREYQMYNQPLTYFSSWMLSASQSPTGAGMTYTYTLKTKNTTDPRNVKILDASWSTGGGSSVIKSWYSLMTESVTISEKVLSAITTSSGMWVSCDPVNGFSIYDPLRSATSFKKFLLAYNSGFLTSVTESDGTGCTKMPPYLLYYTNQANYPVNGSTNQDFWGFYNGAINEVATTGGPMPTYFPTIYVYPNEPATERYRLYRIPSYAGTEVILEGDANRIPDANAILTGTLSRLVYPAGGEMDFTFEAATFYDAKAVKSQYGGGLRIKSVTYFDGVDPTANITKNFSYTATNGHSSGRLITRPAFALPVWQYIAPKFGTYAAIIKSYASLTTTESKWRGLTMMTSWDVASQEYTSGSPVGYARVSVARPGSGTAVFEYSVPAAYGDAATGSAPTDWTPTTMKFARPTGCPSMNIIAGGEIGGYPLFPHTFYDYERGLLQKKSEYNNTGTLVRLTQNTYQYIYRSGSQPASIFALAYDRFANSTDLIHLHGYYKLLTDVANVIASETVITYDENNSARNATETSQYIYGSAYHRYVSRINRTTPDGTIYGTALKYTLDYPVTSTVPSDTTLWMIQLLKNSNRNAAVIEQQYTVQPSGGTEKTTGANLVKFRPFSYNKPLLRYQLAFRPLTLVTDFAPSGVASYAFTNDTRYEITETVNEYTSFDVPLSSTGEDRVTATALWGYNKRMPVAQVSQARPASVGFSDFETTTGSEFTVTNGYYGTGRTGATGVHPYATLTRTVVKPASATNHILSFWLKDQAGTTITLQVRLKDGNGTLLSTTNYTYTLTGTSFQYFTQKINVATMPATFIIEVQGQSLAQPIGSSSSLLPMLDDIGFYPDYATLSSVTYDIPFGANAVTDASGMTSYTTYDAMGRVKWISDQDRNIRQRYTYTIPGQVVPSLVAVIPSIIGDYYIDAPIQFVADPNSCITGTLFEWDFNDGNGFTSPVTSYTSPARTYTVIGNYSVTLRVSHPDYQSVTYTKNFTLTYPPLGSVICATGVKVMTSGVVTETYNCFLNTAGDNWITARVTSITNTYGFGITYTWKKRNTGTTTWIDTGTNSNTLGPLKVELVTPSFELMCVITSTDGRTAQTEIISVTVN